VDEFLRLHKPSQEALQRAEQAKLDLTQLKETDPTRYKMLTAQRVLEVSPGLEQLAISTLSAAFRHYEVFRLEQPDTITLLIFPELSDKEQEKLAKALSQFIEAPTYKTKHAYFRVVTDKTGEHRQLAFPIEPTAWQGQINTLVGPFANQVEAEAWGDTSVRSKNLIHDTVNYAGSWFCDVFSAD
jgi:hypothetical protein